jgi:hypothetical protein
MRISTLADATILLAPPGMTTATEETDGSRGAHKAHLGVATRSGGSRLDRADAAVRDLQR